MFRRAVLRMSSRVAPALLAAVLGCGSPTSSPPAFEPDSIPEAYRHSTAALMWPGAARSFQVTPAGDLYNGEWVTRFSPRVGGAPADSPRVIAYEERWLPVAHWTRRAGEVRWDFEAAALAEPPPRDSGLIVTLEVIATNRGRKPSEASLEVTLSAPNEAPVFAAFDASETEWPRLRWTSGDDPDTAHGWIAARDGSLGSDRSRLQRAWRLGPGESRRMRLLLPAYPASGRALAEWARTPHSRRVAEARDYWRALIARGARFELGDPEVENALRAAWVVMLGCRERRGGDWVPIGNPFQYRDVWLRDGARVVTALSLAGFTREARELARGFLLLQWPHGAFLTQRGQPDGTGQALWAFEQSLLRPEPDPTVERFAESARAAWAWLEWERSFGAQSGWEFGMLRPFADPRDNEKVRAQLVGTDAWSLAGYRAAERLMRAAGRAETADSIETSLRGYRLDFERALARTGSTDVPSSWQGIGLDWGNLAVAWPCGALPPDHPRCQALARRVWADGPGLTTYEGDEKIHTYLAADLALWALVAGEREAADRVLADLLRWRSASGGAAEMASRASGDYERNLPPHTTSAAALVTLVRSALIFDDADTLMLTLGARESWWKNGRVRNAPTRWGLLDLEFSRRGDEAEWRWTPVPVWTSLTLPPASTLAAPPDAPLRATGEGRSILAPPGTGHAIVALRPEAGS